MYIRSINDLVNILPALMTLAKNVNFPTRDCSCFCVHVRLVHHMCILSIVSVIFSCGMETVNLKVSICMPKNGNCVAGPATLSSATGMLMRLKVSLNSPSSRKAVGMCWTEKSRKSSE